jgi:hypothetical protein
MLVTSTCALLLHSSARRPWPDRLVLRRSFRWLLELTCATTYSGVQHGSGVVVTATGQGADASHGYIETDNGTYEAHTVAP